jgi:hypothetical protein
MMIGDTMATIMPLEPFWKWFELLRGLKVRKTGMSAPAEFGFDHGATQSTASQLSARI